MTLFKYRAVCPVCGRKVARSHRLGTRQCDGCGATLAEDRKQFFKFLLFFVFIPVPLLVLLQTRIFLSVPEDDLLTWVVILGIASPLVVYYSVYGAWPLLVVFRVIARGPMCPACKYDLHKSTSDTCPECGVDVREVREQAKRFESKNDE